MPSLARRFEARCNDDWCAEHGSGDGFGMSGVDAIRIVADFTGPGALSRTARGLARALTQQNVAVDLVQSRLRGTRTDPWIIGDTRSVQTPTESRVVLHFDGIGLDWPDPSRAVLQFRQSDTDRVPDRWLGGLDTVDCIVVPSPSSRDALVVSGVPSRRVRMMPLGVDPAVWRVPPPSDWLSSIAVDRGPASQVATRFLHVGNLDHAHIENPAALLAAWIAGTSADDDAMLVLALEHHRGPEAVRKVAARMIEGVARALGKPVAEAAPIVVLPERPREADVPGVYASCTHYLSLCHGTAWDLDMMEAGAAGLRLIAPDHSGYRGWLNGTIATMVPASSEMVDVDAFSDLHRALHLRANWWTADLAAAVAAIREAIEGGDRHRQTARETILHGFTLDHSAAQLVRIAEETLSGMPSPVARRRTGRTMEGGGAGGPGLQLVTMLAYLPVSVLSVEERLEKVRPLLEAEIPLILWVDDVYGPVLERQGVPPWIRLHRFQPWEMPTARLVLEHGENLRLPEVRNPDKDTAEYMTLMNLKTDIIAESVRLGLVTAPYTGFIDANIAKTMDDPAAVFARLAAANLIGLDRVLLPGAERFEPGATPNLFDTVSWVALGSLIILPTSRAGEFEARCREKLVEVLERGSLIWEINIWAMLMDQDPSIFHWFSSDHSDRVTALPNLADPVRDTPGAAGAWAWRGSAPR